MIFANDRILARAIEIEHDANDIRLPLRHANVRDAAAADLVIQARRHAERGAFQVDDDAARIFEHEVDDLDRRAFDRDDDIRVTGSGHNAQRCHRRRRAEFATGRGGVCDATR